MHAYRRSIATSLVLLAGMPLAAQDRPAPNNDPETGALKRGALSGASIFLSPGHGWMWENGKWVVQRTVFNGVIEDHSNAEAVLQYLVPLLENAGARVYVARERDMQTNMVIVDDGGPGYTATGKWSTLTAPGTWGGTLRRATTTTGRATATAQFIPTIPEAGHYAVYAWYRTDPSGDRVADDARFVINHAGGTYVFQQDLARDGHTWKYLGTYWFDAGQNADKGSVTITNQSQRGGRTLIVDAVRFGGGMGDVLPAGPLFADVRPDGMTVSGKPRWEESGHTQAPFMGYDPRTSTNRWNQIRAMPAWTQWEAEPWEKGRSVYLSWHTNGSADHTISGLSSYIYGIHGWSSPRDFSGHAGGIELANAVHDTLLDTMRRGWDPKWEDVGKITRWLGETNPEIQNEMPALLVENGFHDHPGDAAGILTPRFRATNARGVYHGLLRYYADYMPGFDNVTRLPESPTDLRVFTAPDGRVTVSWQAPRHRASDPILGDAATGYRVYRSRHGKAFDNGTPTREPMMVIDSLEPNTPLFVRVTATNAGGESLATETLAVSRPRAGRAPVLIVNGFDRLDRSLNIKDGDGAERGLLARMNTFDYSIAHARALSAALVDYDASSDEAVSTGAVRLDGYEAVVWILGRQGGEEGTLDAPQREALRTYLANGGALFISGSELAYDLDYSRRAPGYLAETMKLRYVADKASTNVATGRAGTMFDGLATVAFGDAALYSNSGIYPVPYPDVLGVEKDGVAVMYYGATDEVAAVRYEGRGRVVALGFPFESIVEADQRAEVMRRAIEFLAPDAMAPALPTAMVR